MNQLVLLRNRPDLIEPDELFVNDLGELKHSDVNLSDITAFVIHWLPNHSTEQILDIIAEVRRQDKPKLYLKPIVLITYNEQQTMLDSHVDLHFHRSVNRPDIAGSNEVSLINRWINGLPVLSQEADDSHLGLKSLRLLASRNKKLTAKPDFRFTSGFIIQLFLRYF